MAGRWAGSAAREQVDDVIAGQAGHGRAADVLGRGGRPAGGDEGDQAPGGLGGGRVGLVDLDRHALIAADRWLRCRSRVDVGGVRAGAGGDAVHGNLRRHLGGEIGQLDPS
jgi:hypothetical protein